jgi:hypothetical protein
VRDPAYYSLFTLVGIAGEDDLDAPDLAGQTPKGTAPKNVLDREKLNGGGVQEGPTPAGTLGAFAKNRKPWTPPKQPLAPQASATLRDRLLGELPDLSTADDATAWAQRALGAKNTLRGVDAAVVESAFAARIAELGDGDEATLPSPADAGRDPIEAAPPPGRAELMAALRASVELGTTEEAAGLSEVPAVAGRSRRKRRIREQALPAPTQPAASAQPELQPVNNAVPWHVDKSTLPLGEPRRYRDRAHLEFVASQPCLFCGRQPCDAHHLKFTQPRALGRRVSDEFAVPLCRTHHRALHRSGDEAAWWKSIDLDPVMVAQRLWRHTRLNVVPIQQHIDPLLGAPSVHSVDDGRANPFTGPVDQ